MKLFAQLLTLGLVGQGVVASNWFSKSSKFDQDPFLLQKGIYSSSFELSGAKASFFKLSDSIDVDFRVSSSIFHIANNISDDDTNIALDSNC